MSGDGTDKFPEWDMKHGYMERRPSGCLLLCAPGYSFIVVEVMDADGSKMNPKPSEQVQAEIDKQVDEHFDDLIGYKTRRRLDEWTEQRTPLLYDLEDAVEWADGDDYCKCRYPGPWKTHPDGYGVCDGCGLPHE